MRPLQNYRRGLASAYTTANSLLSCCSVAPAMFWQRQVWLTSQGMQDAVIAGSEVLLLPLMSGM